VLLRLTYLAVTNVFALLRLLPVSHRDKDVEILALRHQVMVLERQLGKARPRFRPADWAFLAAIEHSTRRVRILGATAQLSSSWVVQAARNLVMDLENAGSRPRFLIRDRDGKSPGLSGTVLKDAGITVVPSGV
jgi:hypothetical protein